MGLAEGAATECVMPSQKSARERFIASVEKAGGSREVARMLGCSRSYVDMIRSGERRPGMRAAFAIEQLFEIRMQDWVEPSTKAGRPRRGKVQP